MTQKRPEASSGDPWSTDRLFAVGLGAVVGALLRVWVGQQLPAAAGEFPTGTVVVNVTGCLVMGLLTPPLRRVHPLLALAVTTGALGGYTTFSSFGLDALKLADAHPLTMVAYVVATVVGCVAAATAGLVAGERAVAPRPTSPRRGQDGGR